MQVTGLILAGGLSSRFGTDKAQALYCGHTFMTLAYDLLKKHCPQVVISGTDHRLKVNGIRCLPDIEPGGGPMSGIATAISRLSTEWLLIVPCDMPLLTADIIQATIEAAHQGRTVVWQETEGRLQPFPMLLHRPDAEQALSRIGTAAGISIKTLLRQLPVTTLTIDPAQHQLFSNINTQPEFEKLCQIHQQHRTSASTDRPSKA